MLELHRSTAIKHIFIILYAYYYYYKSLLQVEAYEEYAFLLTFALLFSTPTPCDSHIIVDHGWNNTRPFMLLFINQISFDHKHHRDELTQQVQYHI